MKVGRWPFSDTGCAGSGVRFLWDCVAKLGLVRLRGSDLSFGRSSVLVDRRCLSCSTGQREGRRGTVEKFGEPSEVLRGCCQQHFVPDPI
jgi:hypothetical protein